MEKKNKGMLAIIAVAALILVVGATYAFITFVLYGEKENTITGGSLTVTLDDTDSALGNPEGDLVLEDQFPVSDAVGKTRTPYKFTLTNSSVKDASYTIYLDSSAVTEGATRMDDSKIRIYLTNSDDSVVFTDVTTVSELASTTRTVDGTSVTSRVLYSGVLTHATTTDDVTTPTSQTFSLRMFISSEAGEEIMGQEYATKVSVDAVQVPEYAVTVINGSETQSAAVFKGATATFTITAGTGTASVACTNGMTGTLTDATTFTVDNVTAHTVCTITYTEDTTTTE